MTEGSNHGGKRPGAGRKPTGRKKINFYVTAEEAEKMKKLIQKLRNSRNAGDV
jgi:hypothetical protein